MLQEEEDFRPFDDPDEVSLQEGGRHLVKSMSSWLLPRGEAGQPLGTRADASRSFDLDNAGNENSLRPRRDSETSLRIDVTFATAEASLKRDLKRQYLALAIGCWVALTVIQSVALVCLNYWEYSPVVIAVVIMFGSVVFYWRYVWRHLRLPFKRLWVTPYPFAVLSTVLGSLAQHAIFQAFGGYENGLGQLLIVFLLIQSFYVILVASTYRNYMSKWQKFINHRKLCFDALQVGREKQMRAIMREQRRGRGGLSPLPEAPEY